jgi:uncharacterized protein
LSRSECSGLRCRWAERLWDALHNGVRQVPPGFVRADAEAEQNDVASQTDNAEPLPSALQSSFHSTLHLNMAQPAPPPNPFLLAADNPTLLLTHLATYPALARSQDATGYSLLHAAASYNHIPLLRALIQTYHVPPNTLDNDGETALFVAETVNVAKCLIEELGADWRIKNKEGQTAREKIEEEGEWVGVGAYLRDVEAKAQSNPQQQQQEQLTPKFDVKYETIEESPAEPDPVFKARIESLASRPDFEGEAAQRELRDLVAEAVRGHVVSPGGEEESREGARRRKE